MVPPHRNEPVTPTVTALRVVFGCVLIVALVLGYIGFGQLLGWTAAPLDLLYYDLQLFVLDADPLEDHELTLPTLLQVARFAAPSVTVYAFVEAGRLIFATEWRRVRAHQSRNHVILCGDGAVADMLRHRLQGNRQRVVAIRSTAGALLERPGPLTVVGDARDPDLLRAAGIGRAVAVYACTEDSAVNTAIALTASRTRAATRPAPLAVYAYIRDPDLCLALQARYLGRPQQGGPRLDFFNVDDLAARRLVTTERLEPVNGRPPRVLVVGATVFGRAVVVEAARRWRLRESRAGTELPVTVVDPTGSAAVAEILHRYPFLGSVCRFAVHDADLLRLLADGELHDPPDVAFVCHEDEEYALKTAMTAERLWRGAPRSVVIRLDRLTAFHATTKAGDRADGRLFDEQSSPLRAFGVVHAACDPRLIREDLVERIARVIHDQYRLARRGEGESTRTNQALVDWEDLPPELRESNREQARDIGRKLRAVGCELIPRIRANGDGQLHEDEIERLARIEHDRWRADHDAKGWRYAERRDQARKLHPALRDWEELPDELRRRNHQAVRELTSILADAGFQIVRTGVA
jgi:voltage-gated potassium channel Kch